MNTTTAHNDIAATCFASEADNPVPLELLETSEIESYRSSLTEAELAWLDRQGFTAKSGQFAWLESDGAARVVCGWDGNDNLSTWIRFVTVVDDCQLTWTSDEIAKSSDVAVTL